MNRPVLSRRFVNRLVVPATLLGLVIPITAATPVSAATGSRTEGTGTNLDVSWIELDPDDVLGLPGNVHIGYLSSYSDQYGSYFYGNITDFQCEDGALPWGGHGGEFASGTELAAEIVDTGSEVAASAAQDAVDAVIDSGASVIEPAVVIDEIQTQLASEVTDTIADIIEEVPACEYLQDRFLEGNETTRVKIDVRNQVATVTGTVTVVTGGHGEPVGVLGTPPINVTITGGQRNKFEYSYKNYNSDYYYSSAQTGTAYYNGTVTGAIGAMGFDDDADDTSFGSYNSYRYSTVERVR